mgnify:CR=1 FL=1
MSDILKHVGHIINTGKRCAIVFLQIPERTDHALVVDTEALPDRVHDPLMSLIRSNEAQQSQNLGDIMVRRMLPDSTKSMLQELHEMGYLQAQPVTNINLSPRPNTSVRLDEVLQAMGRMEAPGTVPTSNPSFGEQTLGEQTLNEQASPGQVSQPVEELNTEAVAQSERGVFSANSQAETAEDQLTVAKGMVTQAELLEADAARLRKDAYKMAPSLAPVKEEPKQTVRRTSKRVDSTVKTGENGNEPKTRKTTSTRGRGKKSTG